MTDLKIEYLPIDELKEYKHNAKKHTAEQVEQIANSIREFGMNDPIAIDEDGVIIEGHGRLYAIRKLKQDGKYAEDTVPVIRLAHLTDQQKKAYILAHNKLTMNTGFDLDILNEELSDIIDFDMSDFGFIDEKKDVLEEEPDPEDDNFDGAVPTITRIKRGQIYRLGKHRLMCGDSTDADDVSALMDRERASLFLTDPPYNVAIGDKNRLLNKICKENGRPLKGGRIETNIDGDAGGKSAGEVGKDLWLPAFRNAFIHSADDCAVYVTMPQGVNHYEMAARVAEAGWTVKHELIWVKNIASFSMGRLDYDYQHEPILYGWKKRHNFYATDYKKSVIELIPEDIDNMTEDAAKSLLHLLLANETTSVMRVDKPRVSDLHPTMKPIPLFGRLIKNSTLAGDIVLDLFGGSGTTIIAAEQLGRSAYVMESDPRYTQVIINRWEEYTGKKAELLTP